jgi:hypothetical protein
MHIKLLEEETAVPDDGNEKNIINDASDCSKNALAGEDDSDVEANAELITIPRTLFHPEDKITPMKAHDYSYSCKLGFKLKEKELSDTGTNPKVY